MSAVSRLWGPRFLVATYRSPPPSVRDRARPRNGPARAGTPGRAGSVVRRRGCARRSRRPRRAATGRRPGPRRTRRRRQAPYGGQGAGEAVEGVACAPGVLSAGSENGDQGPGHGAAFPEAEGAPDHVGALGNEVAAQVGVAGGGPGHQPGRPVLADGFPQHPAGVREVSEVVVAQGAVPADRGEFLAQSLLDPRMTGDLVQRPGERGSGGLDRSCQQGDGLVLELLAGQRFLGGQQGVEEAGLLLTGRRVRASGGVRGRFGVGGRAGRPAGAVVDGLVDEGTQAGHALRVRPVGGQRPRRKGWSAGSFPS